MRTFLIGCCAGATLSLLACAGPPPPRETAVPDPRPPAYRPVVSLNEVMVHVVNHNGHVVWDADVPGQEPKTDEQWAGIEAAAVTLAAAGAITMSGGTGDGDRLWLKEPDWQRHSQALAGAGLAAVKAARARNRQALTDAGDALVLSCINCHREYKLGVPEIWAREAAPAQ
jgi:hypothetical protein